MSINSKIEWTETTWNPVTGCSKISPGCKNCYAEIMSLRLKAMGQRNYSNGFDLTLHPQMLTRPFSWKKAHMIFVNSMSDLFHEDVPFEYIQKVFTVMNKAYWHQFQVLTKRSERLAKFSNLLTWSSNIWMGVSVENNDFLFRINNLIKTNAHIKFVSFEPLLEPVKNLDLTDIDWVIVGGESGSKSRPMLKDWILYIKNYCLEKDIPFFFKQWGGKNKKKNGRILEGKIWEQMPKKYYNNFAT